MALEHPKKAWEDLTETDIANTPILKVNPDGTMQNINPTASLSYDENGLCLNPSSITTEQTQNIIMLFDATKFTPEQVIEFIKNTFGENVEIHILSESQAANLIEKLKIHLEFWKQCQEWEKEVEHSIDPKDLEFDLETLGENEVEKGGDSNVDS